MSLYEPMLQVDEFCSARVKQALQTIAGLQQRRAAALVEVAKLNRGPRRGTTFDIGQTLRVRLPRAARGAHLLWCAASLSVGSTTTATTRLQLDSAHGAGRAIDIPHNVNEFHPRRGWNGP